MDPVTIITGATVAFNTVKKMIEAGRELEDCASQLGQWFSAVSDFNHVEEQTKNPPLFKKITHGKSIEQEALDLMIHRKKLKDQEDQLRELILWTYGEGAYKEMMSYRKVIREERDRAVYQQQKLKKKIIDSIIILVAISGSLWALIATVGFMLSLGGK
jgi:predicted class III extradiol MEMO1 family dioxygenase